MPRRRGREFEDIVKVGIEFMQQDKSQEDRESYSAAEIDARKAKRGLWREPQPVPPWEWRRIQRYK